MYSILREVINKLKIKKSNPIFLYLEKLEKNIITEDELNELNEFFLDRKNDITIQNLLRPVYLKNNFNYSTVVITKILKKDKEYCKELISRLDNNKIDKTLEKKLKDILENYIKNEFNQKNEFYKSKEKLMYNNNILIAYLKLNCKGKVEKSISDKILFHCKELSKLNMEESGVILLNQFVSYTTNGLRDEIKKLEIKAKEKFIPQNDDSEFIETYLTIKEEGKKFYIEDFKTKNLAKKIAFLFNIKFEFDEEDDRILDAFPKITYDQNSLLVKRIDPNLPDSIKKDKLNKNIVFELLEILPKMEAFLETTNEEELKEYIYKHLGDLDKSVVDIALEMLYKGESEAFIRLICPTIENLIRQIIIIKNGNYIDYDKKKNIERYKTLGSLLNSDELEKHFTIPFLTYLKMILTDTQGLNIRNTSLHGLKLGESIKALAIFHVFFYILSLYDDLKRKNRSIDMH